jgi:hypothetical protein
LPESGRGELSSAATAVRSRKNGKRPHGIKPGSSNLFYLWHKIQGIKSEAEKLKDAELVFMIGLVELLVEERATPGATALATVDMSTPH